MTGLEAGLPVIAGYLASQAAWEPAPSGSECDSRLFWLLIHSGFIAV